MQDIETVIR